MNQKRIQAEFEIVVPEQWAEEQCVQMLAEYLKINKIVGNVIHVTAYPMNYKLMTQYLELPVERVQ